MAEQNPTLDQLKAEMRSAIDEGRDSDVAKLAKSIQKHSTDIVKAEADKVKKEAESLAGDREKLAVTFLKSINALNLSPQLAKVKAKGFTYHLADDGSDIPYLGLTVPTVRKSGGGGGGTGESIQSQTGLRRSELIDKYGTSKEKADIQKAFDGAASSPGSARWSAEKPVVKRILVDNPELIKR